MSLQYNKWPDRIPCLYRQNGELYGLKHSIKHDIGSTVCHRCSMILDPDYYIEEKLKKRVSCFHEYDENNFLLTHITSEQLVSAIISEKNEKVYKIVVKKYIELHK